jgi:MraZ protein
MVVPMAVRKELPNAGVKILVLQRNLHRRCINIYTKKKWVEMLAGFQTPHAMLSDKESDFIRELSRGNAEVEPDESSGRILIPRKLLDWIGAKDEVILVGHGAKLEIWETKQYELTELSPEETAKMAAEMYERLNKPV